MILSHWYWLWWSIITSKPDVHMDFGHIEFAETRIIKYEQLI